VCAQLPCALRGAEGLIRELRSGLATRIAEVCRSDPRVVGVVVEVRKLQPPVRAMLRHVGVRIER